jgi:hypothetical protein
MLLETILLEAWNRKGYQNHGNNGKEFYLFFILESLFEEGLECSNLACRKTTMSLSKW